MHALQISIRSMLFFTVLTGLAYPLAMLGLGQMLFPDQANGSLIRSGSTIVGSELIGQFVDKPEYFHSRPSATSPKPYNGEASSGSNLGPLHPDRKPLQPGIPIDLQTASGSGLDPHISPEAARYQVARIGSARNLPAGRINGLIDAHIEPPQFGLLGEPRVNVLKLNLALDALR